MKQIPHLDDAADSGEQVFRYAPRWTIIVFGGFFFLLCAVVLGAKAKGNTRGVILDGIVTLSPSGATTFYWVLCASGIGFVVISIFLAYHRITFRQQLVFGPTAMIVPVSRWSHDVKRIAYDDIVRITTARLSGQRFLYITHTGGKYTIAAAMLSSKAVFDEVYTLLEAKIDAFGRMAEDD